MSSLTNIRWNGLFFDMPPSWDVIVKDTRHLIIEAELKPMLEIRWQPGATGSAGTFDKIAAKLCRDGGLARSSGHAGQLGGDLSKNYQAQRFSSARSRSESVLLLTCTTCGATVLMKIYAAFQERHAAHPSVLGSLCCHPGDRERRKWRIQDFYFYVPDGFELKSASFRLGLAQLLFTSKAAELTLFRLAAAAQQIQETSLTELFASLCSASPADQLDTGPLTLHFRRGPGTVERIWAMCRRKKPYRAAALRHFPLRDRILGYTISSRRPIGEAVTSAIENGYGIIQEEEGDTGADQGSGAELYPGQK